jgi:putative ABC transport system substrate-binding protein
LQRRQFIALLGCAAAWLGVARAQEPRKIGFLCLGNPDPTPFLKALTTGLHDLGYLEGKDIRLEVRSAVGSAAKLASLAADLVTSKVAVIVAFRTPAATAAKAATGDIPIVMYVADPVRQGLAKSISKPGGNLTGVDPLAETLQKESRTNAQNFSCHSTGGGLGQRQRSISRAFPRTNWSRRRRAQGSD